MNSENPISHFTKILDSSADTLINARKKLTSLAPHGTILVMEKVISGGESKITQTAPTFEEVNRLIDRQLPTGAAIMNRNNNNIIKRAKVSLKARNEAAAALEGEQLARVKLSTEKVSLVSTQIKEKGHPGFMGVGGEPNVYELEFTSYASVTVKYRLPVTLKGLFAEEGKIVQEAKQAIANIRDTSMPDVFTKWLFYEAIIQPEMVLSSSEVSLIDSLFRYNRAQRENRPEEGGWVVAPERIEKFKASLVERMKENDQKCYCLAALLRLVDPSGADKSILQVCKACGHVWEDDGSDLHKCIVKCERCGEKKNWGSHQWISANEKVSCAICKKGAYTFKRVVGVHFCKDCDKYTLEENGDSVIYCSFCHQRLWPSIGDNHDPDNYDYGRDYEFERSH